MIVTLVITNLITGMFYLYQKNQHDKVEARYDLVTRTLEINQQNAKQREKENKYTIDTLYSTVYDYWQQQVAMRDLNTARERAKLEKNISRIQSMLDGANSMLQTDSSRNTGTQDETNTARIAEAQCNSNLSATENSLSECRQILNDTVRAAVDTDLHYERLYNIKASECAVYGCE